MGEYPPLLLGIKRGNDVKIEIPPLADQQQAIIARETQKAMQQLEANLVAPVIESALEIDETQYSHDHLLDKPRWQAPHKDIVAAYFKQFQSHFPAYSSDAKLATLLGLSSDRRVREYKSGARKINYETWRRFLVITGRAPQQVLTVLAYMR